MKLFYCGVGRLCLCLLAYVPIMYSPARGQPAYTVQGKVVSAEDGAPLAGVSVLLKGSTQGTTTGPEGDFQLPVKEDKVILSSSFIGYRSLETIVLLPLKQPLTIRLTPQAQTLDQTVVIGYGTTSRRLNTGSVGKVTAEQIARQPVGNPLLALAGKVAGLLVTQQTGVPGGAVTVQIRGQHSIANGSSPFYVIDGVPYNGSSLTSLTLSQSITGGGAGASPFASLDPSEIESIQVLKDADATAIYGSRGAGGVILITTKKGKAGKTRLDAQLSSGVGRASRMIQLLGTDEYIQMRQEAFANDGAIPAASDYDVNGRWDQGRQTDWQKTLIGGTARIYSGQLSVSGGSGQTQFLASGGYRKETTVFPGDFSQGKSSARLQVSHASADQKFHLDVSAGHSTAQGRLMRYSLAGYLYLPPNAPALYRPDGSLNWEDGSWTNPLRELLRTYTSNNRVLTGSASASYRPVEGLQLKTSLGYNSTGLDELQKTPLSSFSPASGAGAADAYSYFARGTARSWIIEPQLDYGRDFSWGKLGILIGGTLQDELRQKQTLLGTGFATEQSMGNAAAAWKLTVTEQSYNQYRYLAGFGRLSYNWRDKWVLNLTGRRDGSSRFGPGRQFATFAAVGAAWIFSSEKSVQQRLPALSLGKLRASYGTAGNDQIGDYQYLEAWGATANGYQGQGGLYPLRAANAAYGWEVTRKLEVALELGLWANRLTMTGSYFSNTSSNQLVSYPLGASTGFSSVQKNLGARLRNYGAELTLTAVLLKTRAFSWDAALNVTVPRNKLLAFPGLASSGFYQNHYEIGKPLSVEKAYHYTGLDQEKGVYTFQDLDGDGAIRYPQDLTATKKIGQDCYGGLESSLAYKGLRLDVSLQFVSQTARNYLSLFSMPGSMSNQPQQVMGRWQEAGQDASIQRFTQDYGSPAARAYAAVRSSDYAISGASYVRLRNIQLEWRRGHLRLYIQGQNLLTLTRYEGMDPETGFGLPPLKMLVAGANITI